MQLILRQNFVEQDWILHNRNHHQKQTLSLTKPDFPLQEISLTYSKNVNSVALTLKLRNAGSRNSLSVIRAEEMICYEENRFFFYISSTDMQILLFLHQKYLTRDMGLIYINITRVWTKWSCHKRNMGEQVQTENNNVRLQYSKVGKAEAAKFFFELKI